MPEESITTKQWFLLLWYLSSVPPNGRVWHKAFLRWVRAQGRSPHVPGISKNATDPVGINLKRHLRRRAINQTSPKRVKAWWTAPWGQRYIQWQETPDLNRPSHHSRPNVSHQLDMSLLERPRSDFFYYSYFITSRSFLWYFFWIFLRGPSPGGLGNVEYFFIIITPRSNLARGSSTSNGPMSQIEMFNHLLRIIICQLKPYGQNRNTW